MPRLASEEHPSSLIANSTIVGSNDYGPADYGYSLPEQPATAAPNSEATFDFEPDETTLLERPLLSELSGTTLAMRLSKVYEAISDVDLKTAAISLNSRYMKDVWAHETACSPPASMKSLEDVHMSWLFLPWHRGFVYFHERLIRSLSGMDDFRLPVWDWEKAQGVPVIPAPYAQWNNWLPLTRKQGQRDKTALLRQFTAYDLQDWLGSSAPEEFAGSNRGQGKAAGGIPHSTVHTDIGGFMGFPKRAAADPIFFAHHTNVDRFWTSWLDYYLPKFQSNPIHKAWLDKWMQQTLIFFDHVDRNYKRVSVSTLVHGNFGYRYKPPEVTLTSFIPEAIPNRRAAMKGPVVLNIKDLSKLLNGLKMLGSGGPGGITLSDTWRKTQIDVTDSLKRGDDFSLPIQLEVELDHEIMPGHYAVGLQSNHKEGEPPIVLGDFALFGQMHQMGRLIVSLRLSRDQAVQFVQIITKTELEASFQVVYGNAVIADAELTLTGPPKPLTVYGLEIRYPPPAA